MDTGAIISQESWNPNWPLQDVATQFLGIGTLFQVKQSIEWIKCVGPEGHVEILKTKVADIAMNSWGKDLLQQ